MTVRGENAHDYDDINSSSTLNSQKTQDYCEMEPQSLLPSPLLLRFSPPEVPPPATPPPPAPKPSGSFSIHENKRDRPFFVRRSISMGPSDLYSYRKQPECKEKNFNFESFVNNGAIPEVQEQLYGSWYSNKSHKSLLNNCDGSCSVRTTSVQSRRVDKDRGKNVFSTMFSNTRYLLAVGMVMIGLIAGNVQFVQLYMAKSTVLYQVL